MNPLAVSIHLDLRRALRRTADAVCAITAASFIALILASVFAPSAARAGALSLDTYTADPEGLGATSTLIYGEHEAILVDAQFRTSDAEKLAARIAARGRHLKAILITHPHFDHYFGTAVLLKHFPGTPVYATAAQIENIQATLAPSMARVKGRWGAEIPADVPIPQRLPGMHFIVDGEAVEVVPDVQGDAGPKSVNSYVWIPSLAAVIAGDIDYNRSHVYVGVSTAESRKAWRQVLDGIQDRHPRVVVAGHKLSPGLPDGPESLQFTLGYLAAVEPALAASHSAKDFIAEMKRRYPDIGGVSALALGAGRLLPN